ncbi:MAG TPA: tetratricopeptide repeat protein [Terracidiphilus sp.]|nr:tetratricopeptide repeat protein [Terracidiphilus sp.]
MKTILMKTTLGVALVAGCLLAAEPPLRAQAPASQNANPQNQKKPANSQPSAQQNANQFPEDESSVPVLPSKNTPDLPSGSFDGSVNGRAVLPAGDVDPVQSPDDSPAAANGSGPDSSSSSSLNGIDSLMPGPDDEQPSKHGRKQDQIAPEHHENAAEDESVGKYYLDNKDWRAARSRYQSAMVLDPDNPDVYWGLAEADRHLGNYAEARTNYLKVMEYDPDSKHAKEAKKALSEPELANVKPAAASNAAPQK